jgi:pimeloyl-ACP methyl ester carboxylesterase
LVNLLLAIALSLPPAKTEVVRRFTFAPGETVVATLYGDSTVTGSTVVILPGLLGSGYGFRKVTPALLEAGKKVVVVDVLGTGESTRPSKADYSLTAQMMRVAAVLDSLQIKDAVILANALGGSVAYRLAWRRPDLVHAIVGIDAGASEEAGTPGLRKAMGFAPIIKLLGAKRIMVGKVRGGLKESSADPSWVTDEVVNGYTAPYRENAGAMMKVLQAMAESKEPIMLTPNLPDVRVPVKLLVGDTPKGKTLAPEKIEVLRNGLPNFQLEVVPGAGQFVHEERPQVVIDAVLAMTTTASN